MPSTIALERLGARFWIATLLIIWGSIASLMAFVEGPTSFYIMRFLVGAAEAGFFPGVILYLTYWYPAAQRARIVALFMTGIPIAGIIGGPVSGWILNTMVGVQGLAGWQWLFLIEALPSLVLGVAVLAYLDDGIAAARWLTPEEKGLLARRIADDQKDVVSHSLRDGVTNPRVWLLSTWLGAIFAGSSCAPISK